MADEQRPTFHYNGTKGAKDPKSKWWAQPEAEMHEHIFAVVRHIRAQQSYRTQNNLRFARLYGNMEMLGLQAGLFARVASPESFIASRLSLNLIEACVDTAVAKIGGNKTRPYFLTDGGDWAMQRRAQKLTRFMEGAFDSMGTAMGDNRTLYGISRRAFLDSAVLGTGPVKFWADERKNAVKAERVLVEEIVVDETEGMYECPRQMHQEKLIDRTVVADMAESKYRDKIMTAPSGIEAHVAHMYSADMIKVVESWHLPSGPTAKDGRKAMSIDGCTLRTDDWKREWFPFLFKRWKTRLLGFYGCGIAEQVVGLQLEINKKIRTIAIADHLCAAPQVWLEIMAQGATPPAKVDNEIGGVKYYRGNPPIFTSGATLPPGFYSHLWDLWNKGFEIVGVSQLSAAAKKPPGLDAKVALREYQDIESERFSTVEERDANFYLDAAYITMDLMNDLTNPSVRHTGQHSSDLISWKDVKIDIEKLQIRAFPTDILPSQPPGKLAKVQELTEGGFFEKDEAYELLDYPDLKNVTSLKLAPRQNVRRILEKIIDEGKDSYITPEPYMNLEICRNLAQAYYNRGQVDNMPEDRLDLLRRFMDDTQDLIDKAKAGAASGPVGDAAQAGAAAAEAPTIGQPAQQPVSELLPIAQ